MTTICTGVTNGYCQLGLMELALSVPALSTRLLTDIETRPEKVHQWLAQLPLLNATETGRKLLSTLSIYNRIALDDEARLKIFELYRYSVQQVSRELEKRYAGLALPMPEKQRKIVDLARELQVEMAYGYKRIAASSAQEKRSQRHGKISALIIERSLRYLTEILTVCYKSYTDHPQGTWREIHALHRYAETTGIAQIPMEDSLNRHARIVTVAGTYKHALLLNCSNPYALSPREIDMVCDYLERWAGLAQLGSAGSELDPTCRFLIEPGADCANGALEDRSSIENPERYRVLNTTALVRLLHKQLTTAEYRPSAEGSDVQLTETAHRELLVHLIKTWGLHPRRHFQRSARPVERIELIAGVKAINYWINGAKEFVPSSMFVGPMPQRAAAGGSSGNDGHDDVPKFEPSAWDILDESASGFALKRHGLTKTRLRVGDLIATRPTNKRQGWALGVVRWAKSASPSEIDIGTQRLAPHAEPVLVKMITNDNKESDFVPGLLLPKVEALKQPGSLITPCGLYKPDRVLYLDNGYRLFPVRATALTTSTAAFEQFGFRPCDT